MEKKTKILTLAAVTGALSVAIGITSNYFYNYAILRKNRTIHNKKFGNSIYTKSFDGLKLHAYQNICENKSHKWAILVHGYTENSVVMSRMAKLFLHKGFNVITPDCRAHGKSEGKYIGMGWHDRLDIISWINTIVKMDKDAEIVLYGVSMGGATVMMAAGEDLPNNVKCIVQDCGYTSVHDIFKYQLKQQFGLPSFPIMYLADIVCRIRAGYGFRQGSAVKQVAKTKLPILFIHGEKDSFVPTSMVFELYKKAGAEKEILIIKDAGHARSYIKNKKLYLDTMWKFIDRHI